MTEKKREAAVVAGAPRALCKAHALIEDMIARIVGNHRRVARQLLQEVHVCISVEAVEVQRRGRLPLRSASAHLHVLGQIISLDQLVRQPTSQRKGTEGEPGEGDAEKGCEKAFHTGGCAA